MRPLRLTLENFLSYRGVHQIDLDGVTLAVLSGPNGSGKSSLVDAMRFALFGHTRGGLDGVITEGEQACRVEFTFALGEQAYLVCRQRSRKGSGSTLLFFQMISRDGSAVLDGKSVAETQRRIEQTLRLTDDLFCMTACANQGNSAAFSQAKPAERKQVLSDILDLAAWERRAEMTRQMGRDLAGRIESEQTRHEALQGAAAGADALRGQIVEIEAVRTDVERQVAQAEGDLAQEQEAKEAFLRDREADRARRKELEELAGRLRRLQAEMTDPSSRLELLRRTVKDKPSILEGLRRAEEAHTYSQELEAKRQEADRLDNEIRLLEERAAAAKREHGAQIKALQDAIAGARREHAARLRAAEEAVAAAREIWRGKAGAARFLVEALAKQARPLSRVPCGDKPMLRDSCPLIENAREAASRLPSAQRELEDLEQARPWAEAEQELERLRALEPALAAPERQRLAELEEGDPSLALAAEIATRGKQRAEIGYDPKEHAEAKRQAGRLQELQQTLHQVERAEAQMAEVQANLRTMQGEIKQIQEREAALAEELGPPRDWDAMLREVEKSIREVREELVAQQARLPQLGEQRGALEERLRAAEQAAKEAEELTVALREGERRLQVLKVLAQAFGKQGIPALLIEKAVPDLEAVANDVLSALSDGRLSVALRSQRETKAKTLQETLEIIISDERGERAYENYSGGEGMRVDLALRIALSVLLASRAGARCEMLVLDETAAPLDVQGRALFVESLQKIADHFATILVITHVEELKDLFPFRFEISKTAEGSRVKMEAA